MMGGPKMVTNPKGMRPWSNTSRPNDCSELATSLDPTRLFYATAMGNRATRREATRNLLKQARRWAKTAEGKRTMVDMASKL